MKPWERDWSQAQTETPAAKPWERDWSAPQQPQSVGDTPLPPEAREPTADVAEEGDDGLLGAVIGGVQDNVVDPFARGIAATRRNFNTMQGVLGLDQDSFAEDFASAQRMIEQYPPSPEQKAALQDFQQAEGWGESAKALGRHPGLVVSTIMESFPQMTPSFIGGAVGGTGGALFGGGAGGVPGLMGGVGVGSYMTEFSNVIAEEMEKLRQGGPDPDTQQWVDTLEGVDLDAEFEPFRQFLLQEAQSEANQPRYDLTNADDVRAAFEDPEFLQNAKYRAGERAQFIALLDALSAGLAGRVAPLFRTANRKASTLNRAGRRAAGELGEVATQSSMGAAGEYAAQINEFGEIKSKQDVLLEGVAEVLPGMVERANARLTERTADRRRQAAERERSIAVGQLGEAVAGDRPAATNIDPQTQEQAVADEIARVMGPPPVDVETAAQEETPTTTAPTEQPAPVEKAPAEGSPSSVPADSPAGTPTPSAGALTPEQETETDATLENPDADTQAAPGEQAVAAPSEGQRGAGEQASDAQATTAEVDELDTRPKRRKSKAAPGPLSYTRTGDKTIAQLNRLTMGEAGGIDMVEHNQPDLERIASSNYESIWTDQGLDPEKVILMSPARQFKLAADQMKKTFGFMDIERDNNLQMIEAIDVLKDAYVSLQAMAAVLGVPRQQMSFNGILKLNLHQKAGGALAYHRASSDGRQQEIGVVRRNDSFAHEWGHALDARLLYDNAFDLVEKNGRLLSGKVRGSGKSQRLDSQVADAFAHLLNTLFFDQAALANRVRAIELAMDKTTGEATKAKLQKQLDAIFEGKSKARGLESSYYKMARKVDAPSMEGGSRDGYWQRPTEMLARAFEAYIARRVTDMEAPVQFIAMQDYLYRGEAPEIFHEVYPKAEEREAIFAAFDNLFAALREKAILEGAKSDDYYDVGNIAVFDAELAGTKAGRQHISLWENIQQEIRNRESRVEDRARQRRLKRQRKEDQGTEGNVWLDIDETATDIGVGFAKSIRGVLRSYMRTYPNSQAVKQFNAWFATAPGSQEFHGGKYEETVRRLIRQWSSRWERIVRAHGIAGWTDSKKRRLRDLLTEPDVDMDYLEENFGNEPDFIAAAAATRKLYNDLYYVNQQGGINIGFADNYLQRHMDVSRILENPNGFRTQARQVYAIKFDNDIGEFLADPEHMDRLAGLAKLLLPQSETYKRFRKLRRKIKNLKKSLDRAENTDAVQDEINEAEAELENVAGDLFEETRPEYIQEATEDWLARLTDNSIRYFEYERRGPAGSYDKNRVLPKETDKIMGGFMITDVMDLVPTYINQSVTRSVYADFFGKPNETGVFMGKKFKKSETKSIGWKLDWAFQQLGKEGVSEDHQEEIRLSTNVMTAHHQSSMTRRGMQRRANLLAIYTTWMLSRAMYSQLAEPAAVGSRMEDVTAPFRAFAAQMGDLVDFADRKSWLPKSAVARAQWRKEMSEFAGITESALAGEVMSARMNLLYQNPETSRRLSKFFLASLIHPHTMSLRRAVMEQGFKYVGRIARRAQKGDADAKAALGELGIAGKGAIEYLANMDKRPAVQGMAQSPYREMIFTAINRFVDEASPDPKAVDKPRLATQPEYAYLYGILSFQSAFQQNFLIRNAKRITKSWQHGPLTGAKVTSAILLAWGTLIGLQWAALMLRMANWGDLEKWEEKETSSKVIEVLSRSGTFGLVDPLLNTALSAKYQKDLTTLTAGTIPGYVLQEGQDLVTLLVANSENTNTAEFNAIEGGYNVLAAPMMWRYALSSAPVNNMFGRIATGALYMGGSSSKARGEVAEAIVGEKGSETDENFERAD